MKNVLTLLTKKSLTQFNSLVHNAFLLLRHFKKTKKRQKRNRNARRLYKRKKLHVNVKKYKKKRKSALYSVNCDKKPINRLKQQKRHKKH